MDASIDDYDLPQRPLKYTVMKYRQKMNVSYEEVMRLPAEVMFHDLQMIDIESEYGI